MSKRPIYTTGHYYHLYNRGRSRLPICHDHHDYLDILARLKKYSRKYHITVIAYALLPNHYHFLVRQDDAPRASLLTQRVFNSYSKVYNRKYDHSGTIFQGTVQSIPVQDDAYLRHLCRYIHANPVLHGLVASLNDWLYTNYHEWMGTRHGALIDRDFIEAQFDTVADYRRFVLDYLRHRIHPEGFDYLAEW